MTQPIDRRRNSCSSDEKYFDFRRVENYSSTHEVGYSAVDFNNYQSFDHESPYYRFNFGPRLRLSDTLRLVPRFMFERQIPSKDAPYPSKALALGIPSQVDVTTIGIEHQVMVALNPSWLTFGIIAGMGVAFYSNGHFEFNSKGDLLQIEKSRALHMEIGASFCTLKDIVCLNGRLFRDAGLDPVVQAVDGSVQNHFLSPIGVALGAAIDGASLFALILPSKR